MINRFSTIRISNRKCHIYDYKMDKLLCGVDRWDCKPFKINKTSYDAKEMLKRHKSFAERRGGPNPYKFTCMKCESILEKMLK